jgi:hypothetical protein
MSYTYIDEKNVICNSCIADGILPSNCIILYHSFKKHYKNSHSASKNSLPPSTSPTIAVPSKTESIDLKDLVEQMSDLKAQVLFIFLLCGCFVKYSIHRHQNILLNQEVQKREEQFQAMLSPVISEDDTISELCTLLRSNARLMCEFKDRLNLVDASGTKTPIKRQLSPQ